MLQQARGTLFQGARVWYDLSNNPMHASEDEGASPRVSQLTHPTGLELLVVIPAYYQCYLVAEPERRAAAGGRESGEPRGGWVARGGAVAGSGGATLAAQKAQKECDSYGSL